MRAILFHGRLLKTIRPFPGAARRNIGHQLDRIQRGFDPIDWKPMKQVGPGARELRVRENGQFRVICLAVHSDVLHVLHAFQKKTRRTRGQDLEQARKAYQLIVRTSHD